MAKHRIYTMSFASVYPLYVANAEKKGRTKSEVDQMLELVERTGREFGIAVMVTSHLLGEIERVCEHLMAIDGGKLHYSGPVSAFTKQTTHLILELDDEVPAFADRLRAAGLEVDGHGLERTDRALARFADTVEHS